MEPVTVPPVVIWSVFGGVVFLYAIFSAILIFHWNKYGGGKRLIRTVRIIYFSVSALLLVTASVAVIVFMYGQA